MLWYHIEKVHVSDDIKYTCQRPDCRRNFLTRRQLLFHLERKSCKIISTLQDIKWNNSFQFMRRGGCTCAVFVDVHSNSVLLL